VSNIFLKYLFLSSLSVNQKAVIRKPKPARLTSLTNKTELTFQVEQHQHTRHDARTEKNATIQYSMHFANFACLKLAIFCQMCRVH